jgi:hypothetical protein
MEGAVINGGVAAGQTESAKPEPLPDEKAPKPPVVGDESPKAPETGAASG